MRVGGVMKAGAFVNFDPIDAVPLPSRRSEERSSRSNWRYWRWDTV